jgi:hypothetical protein
MKLDHGKDKTVAKIGEFHSRNVFLITDSWWSAPLFDLIFMCLVFVQSKG